MVEPIQIKKISLKLYGNIKLNVTSIFQGPRGPTTRNIKYDKRFYEKDLDDIDVHEYLVDGSTLKKSLSRSSSSSSIGGLSRMSRSTTSLKNLAVAASHPHVLPEGNYIFPFSTILPGSMTESVEGLPNASVFYKLQATIERGKFASDISTKRHLRIVRTLTPDALELFETMAVDNTWPQKVDYSISVPSRAIAIGSSTTISILIVPLLKGLKLGPIKVSLVEYSTYCAPYGNPNGAERTVIKLKLADPLNHMKSVNESGNAALESERDVDISFQDKWEVETSLRVPANLSKCTQDCVVMSNIKVRHKLKFVIALVNPDGHVSELRASLPVQLFISPFVTVAVKHAENIESSANNSASNTDNEEAEEDDLMFANSNSVLNLETLNGSSNVNARVPNTSLFAPPNYGRHVYDRLWSDISVEDTPINSGTQSPVESHQAPLLSNQSNMNELERSLQQVRLERELDDINGTGLSYDTHIPSRSSMTTPISLADVPSQLRVNDYFSLNGSQGNAHSMVNIPSHIRSPPQMISPGYNYLSRANSFDFRVGSPRNDWEISSLSRVPSYDNALKTSSAMGDLPPAYPSDEDDAGGNTMFTTGSLERPKELHLRGVTDVNHGLSKMSAPVLMRNNNNSSNLISNMYTEDDERAFADSSPNKSSSRPVFTKSTSTTAIKNTAGKQFGFNMTPLAQTMRSATPPASFSSQPQMHRASSKSNLSNISLNRGNSFASLVGILHKKEKS